MFGCGKFDELRMLAYLEGLNDSEIDKHLGECMECLREVVELNRISSRMDSVSLSLFEQGKFLILKAEKNKIKEFYSTLGSPGIVEIGVRKEPYDKSKIFKAKIKNGEIKVFIDENGKFSIVITQDKMKAKTLELTKQGEEVPFFVKKGRFEEALIKQLGEGKYILKIDDEKIWLNFVS